MHFRKSEELRKGIDTLSEGNKTRIKLLTTCPACQQGLSRYTDETGLKPEYIVLETIRRLQGEQWQQQFLDKLLRGGIEMVLV